jgi:hypothetical protein
MRQVPMLYWAGLGLVSARVFLAGLNPGTDSRVCVAAGAQANSETISGDARERWRGREFIDSTDHGRQLQSACRFDLGRSGEF